MNLENLKVEDKVVLEGRISEYIRVIKRITKTQIILNDDSKFNKNGKSIGTDVWNTCYIRPATEQDVERITEKALRNKLIKNINDFDFSKLNTSTLKTINDILKENV